MTRGRIALLGVLAIVIVLLGVLVVVLDDGDEDLTTDATTTTTDATTTSSSTTSTTVPVSTTVVPASTLPPSTTSTTFSRRALLAEGDGWTATRTTSGEEHCIELTSAVATPVNACGIGPAAAVLGDVLSVPVPGGLLVAATTTFAGDVEVWTNAGGARPVGFVQPVGDASLVTVLVGVVEASERVHVVVREGEHVVGAAGNVPTGGHVPATELGLRVGHPFTALDGYQVFMDGAQGGFRSMDAGRYVDGDGRECILVRELLPEPRAVLDRCDVEPPALLGEAILLPTDAPGRFDFVGLAAPEVASWGCELPDGTDCDLGGVALGADLPYRLLLHTGPIGIDGTDPDHLVIVLFDTDGAELGRAQVATP